MRRAHHAAGNQYSAYDPQQGDSVLESENDRMTDDLKGKIKSLKDITIAIGSEVRDQNRYLGEMDDEIDNAGGFLGKAMGRVKKLAKGSHNYIVLYLVMFSFAVFFLIWILIKL